MSEAPLLLRWLRVVSLTEAVSYLVLLVVAYVHRIPLAVKYVGMTHGALFLILTWLLVRAYFDHGWPVKRLLAVFLATWVPFVPFLLDARIRGWIASTSTARA